ncbi:Surfactin synthase thioesterase subunit [Mycobacterium rhizamassiliense]|jgi:surfactin synthase thioesterase subunit|uniref:Thioesterase TesA n=1 Tax=Mycobacterium rhizamassiliense TaxID=1841860 RepID=A0A2U3NQP5_9MYCO|nr:alpha/beta fold hydrolase [Mycobacterium rhizamassiliense]SPM33846.1 Surfactin synthase thioesterase subunit [Mycobacterium rhizamassiliense]
MPIEATTWLRALRPVPNARSVVLGFPPGGGSAGAYRALAQKLAPGIAMYAVQYPGRQDRLSDPLVTDMAELADLINADLSRWGAVPNLALFGHSMGATVAFEVARRLQAKNRGPVRLFVSGRIAPDAPYDGRLHTGPDADLIDDLERLANDPASVALVRADPDLASLVLPPLRADYRAVETYVFEAGPRLRCPVSALLGDADPTVTPEQAEGWRAHTDSEFELTMFGGRHFYLDEHVSEVADHLSSRLG